MPNTIRVAVIEEPNSRSDLSRLLQADDIALVAEAGFGAEAITVAQESIPDVIVLSLAEPVARPLRTLERLTAVMPRVGVVAVSALNDRELLRKAVRTGARDFLTRPFGQTELQRTVRAVYEAEQKQQGWSEPERLKDLRTGDLIVLFGGKGGIGKTTLSANLAIAIATETKQRVALVDLDMQMGDIALIFGIPPTRSIADAVANPDRIDPEYLQSFLFTDVSGIRVLPAPASPEESAAITPAQIQKLLDALVRTFDYVIVDTAPALNDANLLALERATLVLLLSTPELASLKRTKISLGLMLKSWNFSEDRIKLVINSPNTHDDTLVSDLEKTLNYQTFWRVPYDPTTVQAAKTGRPCVELKPNARFSRNIVNLARAVCGISLPRRGLISRILRRAS